MPTYRYHCDHCGSFDTNRPLSAFADPCACPDCGAEAVRQLAGPMLRVASAPTATTPAPKAAHRSGCGCCTPAMKPGTAAAAAALGAPKTARTPAPSNFLSRA